jgi:hypothetical protein
MVLSNTIKKKKKRRKLEGLEGHGKAHHSKHAGQGHRGVKSCYPGHKIPLGAQSMTKHIMGINHTYNIRGEK